MELTAYLDVVDSELNSKIDTDFTVGNIEICKWLSKSWGTLYILAY